MIIDILTAVAGYIVGGLVALLPVSAGFPAGVMQASQSIGAHVGMLNPIIPIGTLATILGIILTVESTIFLFKTGKWLVSFLPFIGGKG